MFNHHTIIINDFSILFMPDMLIHQILVPVFAMRIINRIQQTFLNIFRRKTSICRDCTPKIPGHLAECCLILSLVMEEAGESEYLQREE